MIKSHGIHRPADQRHIAMVLAIIDRLADMCLMRYTAASILIAQAGHMIGKAWRTTGSGLKLVCVMFQDRIIEIFHNLAPRAHLRVMRVDIDNGPVVKPFFFLVSGLPRQNIARIGLGIYFLR